MKKLISIIAGIVIIGICLYFFVKKKWNYRIIKKNKTPFSNTEGITTVLTLDDEITDNSIWCGTFQLIWNDLKNELAKQDIVFTPQLNMVENLNKETFTIKDLSEESYYKKIGIPSLSLKKEIEKAIKNKFNEKCDILDDFDWSERNSLDYFLYVMLKKDFQFEKQFEELESGKFGIYDNAKYFGIKKDETGDLRKQVDVLYYKSNNDFAIKLKTKQVDEIILCKNPEGKTFGEIYNKILEIANKKNSTFNDENYTMYGELKEKEILKVPNIKIKEKNEIEEIENKEFKFLNGDKYSIEKALQTIEFKLDKSGGKIKSEAGMSMSYLSKIKVEEKREFSIDDTFAIFLIERGKEKPYFAGKITDIIKFQK